MEMYSTKLQNLLASRHARYSILILLLLFLSFFMVYCFLPESKIYLGYDVYFHYRRFTALMEALKYGTPFTYLDYTAAGDFGYATKWFYPDILLIPFAWIGNLTNVYLGYKLMIFFYTFLCGLIMFATTERISKGNTFFSLTTTLLYTFAFYRLFTLFYRSALGQGLAMTFIPLVFLGLYEILKGDIRRWYWLPIGFSLVILSHLLSSVLLFIVVVVVLLFCYKDLLNNKKRIVLIIVSAIISALLAAEYILPMLELMQSDVFYYSNANPSQWAQNNSYSLLMILSGAFNGFSLAEESQFPSLGILIIMFVLIRIFLPFRGRSSGLKLVDVFVAIGILFVYVSSNLFPWSIYPFKLLNFIQFPTRFNQIVTYIFAFGGGAYVYFLLKNRNSVIRYTFSGILVLLILFSLAINGKAFKAASKLANSGMYGSEPTEQNFYHLGGLEYIPLSFNSYQDIDARKGSIGSERNTEMKNFYRSGDKTFLEFQLNESDDILEFPRFYYKGYKASLNGKELLINESSNGLVSVNVQESGTLELTYAGTILQQISIWISVVSLVVFVFYITLSARKNRQIEGER